MPELTARTCCPACGHTSATTLLRLAFDEDPLDRVLRRHYGARFEGELVERGHYVVDQCDCCTLCFQRNVPNGVLLSRLYDHWLSASATPPPVPDSRSLRTGGDGHEILAVSAALGRPVSALRLLDYGMGWGFWCIAARAHGCQAVYGFDLADTRMRFAAEQGVRTVTLEQIASQTFDFINTEQVFEHLVEPYDVAESLARVLTPGGILKVSVPTAPDLPRRLVSPNFDAPKRTKDSLNPVFPLEHVNCWNPRAITELGARLGLKPVGIALRWQYAFAVSNALHWTRPKDVLKAFARPLYRRFYPHKLYVWLQKSS